MAEQKPVTITPPAAEAAGCKATCELKYTADPSGIFEYKQYQFKATEVITNNGKWVFDHWSWKIRDYFIPPDYDETVSDVGPITDKLYPEEIDIDHPDFLSCDYRYHDVPGWDELEELGEIIEIVAAFRFESPLLVYYPASGELLHYDRYLLNGM